MYPPRKKQRISVLKRRGISSRFYRPNQKSQSLKKAVKFQTYNKVHLIERLGRGLEDNNKNANSTEIKNLWYNRTDLLRFRKQAIELVFLQLKNNNGIMKSVPRGLGSLSTIRKKHKENTIRHILLAHRIGKNQDYLARLCASLGRWNKEIAIRDALVDYLEVYRPSFVKRVPPVRSNPPSISIVSTICPSKSITLSLSQKKEPANSS